MPFSSLFFNHGRPFRWKHPGPWLGLPIFLRLTTDSFRGFFLLFLFDYFGDSRNISTFFILYAISLREKWSESLKSTENNSLAMSSSTWQTEDYFFNKKFYLKTLNPKETQWKHLLYIWSRFFIGKPSWNPCSLRANVSVSLRSGTWSPMARWWPAVILCTSRCVM